MKPLVIDLPDSIRDALEGALASEPQADAHRVADIVGAILYPLKPAKADAPALENFQQRLIELQTGDGCPVVTLGNLPPTQGERLVNGLFTVMDSWRDRPFTLQPNRITRHFGFHQDAPYSPGHNKKMVRGLFCKTQGSQPQPTIFLTADEVIHAMCCEGMGLPLTSSVKKMHYLQQVEYAARHDAIVKQLSATRVKTENIENMNTELHPFLQRNPNYAPLQGAPKFFVCGPLFNHDIDVYDAKSVYEQFKNVSEKLRENARRQSSASRKANTVVIWNEAAVQHDCGGAITEDRLLYQISAQPAVHRAEEANQYHPVARMCAYPTNRIDARSVGYQMAGVGQAVGGRSA